MVIEVDFDYDSDMVDMKEVQDALKAVLESGAESTCTELKLIKVISPKPTLPAAPKDGDLSKLPVGTVFYVHNGGWDGEIVEVDGEKCVHVYATDRKIPISNKGACELHIKVTDYKIPVE